MAYHGLGVVWYAQKILKKSGHWYSAPLAISVFAHGHTEALHSGKKTEGS